MTLDFWYEAHTTSIVKIYHYFIFISLGFLGGASIGFNIYRSANLLGLLRYGIYSDHTIFINTFHELLLGISIGGSIGIGLSLFLKKNTKFFNEYFTIFYLAPNTKSFTSSQCVIK